VDYYFSFRGFSFFGNAWFHYFNTAPPSFTSDNQHVLPRSPIFLQKLRFVLLKINSGLVKAHIWFGKTPYVVIIGAKNHCVMETFKAKKRG
jgi:hypothetical protein